VSPALARTLAWLAVAAFVGLQLLAVHNPRVVEVDPEEMYNAGQAWMLVQGHAADLFRLQYREFCGGCSLDAVLAAPLFAAFGPRWPVWKLVPIGLSGLVLGAGLRRLKTSENTVAAAIFALLFLFPPRAWLHLSLIAWGNHLEAGLVACLGLLALHRAAPSPEAPPPSPLPLLGAGAVLGAAVWVGFSGVFGVVAALGWLAWLRRFRALPWLVGGLALGVLPWAAQLWSTGQHPFVTIYQPGESLPALARLPHKLSTLVAPRQLVALFGMPEGRLGQGLGLGWAASLAAALVVLVRERSSLGRLAALFLASWTAIYLVVRFQIYDPPAPAIAVPGSVRYAAPLYPFAMLCLAVAGGRLAQRSRGLALLLVVPPLLAGLLARIETVKAPFPAPSVWSLHAVDWRYFRNQFAYVLPPSDHRSTTSQDPHARRAHAYALGREESARLLRTDQALGALEPPPAHLPATSWWEGVGDALAAHLQDRAGGSLQLLDQTRQRLETELSPTDAQRRTALRAAAAWRLAPENTAGDSWLRALERHDEASLEAVDLALRGEPLPVQDAVWWAAGRRWATDAVGVALPGAVPAVPGQPPVAFCEGLGHGLGEEWGAAARSHPPGDVSAACQEGWARGVEDGWRVRWLDAPQ
jgi:hypothetical protein